MANTIRIKRSASTNTPGSLLQGEPAYSESGSPNGLGELFIGTTGPSVTKIIRNLNGSPAEPTAGLADEVLVATDYLPFEDATDGQAKRELVSDISLSLFNDDLTYVASYTAGVGLINNGTASAVDVALDFSELTDMTADIAGTTEFILQDGTTESRKAANEIKLSAFNNDIQQIHANYAFDSATTSADPGAGEIRFDNATPASVTNLYVNDADTDSEDWGWVLSNLGDGDVLIIRSVTDTADYLIGSVNGTPTDNTGWWTIPFTVIFSGSLPTAADVLQIDIQWFSQGAAGTVTSVTAGVGLVNSGSASAPVLDFDFSELTDMVGAASGTTEFILQDGTTESRKAANEIDVGIFDNAITEYVSENDALVVADWNWVIDDDTMATASATTLATSESVKAYVDSSVAGGLNYKGGFDPTAGAGAGSPDLDAITSSEGDTYTVTVAGTYNWTTGSAVLEVGDVLIAEQDGVLNNVANWTIVQNNIGAASETVAGYIEIATQAEVDAASSTVLAVVPNYLHNTTFDGGTF